MAGRLNRAWRILLVPVGVVTLVAASCAGNGNDGNSSRAGSSRVGSNGAGSNGAESPSSLATTSTSAVVGSSESPPPDDRDYTGDLDGSDGALDNQSGLANPDPDHLEPRESGDIEVTPRDDPEDYRNLQWAVDNVQPGGEVRLGPGAFFLGDGTTEPKHTVAVRRSLSIRGARDSEQWLTAVQGGGAVDTFSSMGGRLETGPFRVLVDDAEGPVVFRDVWFRNWTGSVVYIERSEGFEMSNCRISNPISPSAGGVRFVHAIFTSGEEARGQFVARDNVVDLGTYPGEAAHDEQFMGVFYSNHSLVEVTGNSITGMDEAIEIIGNGIRPDGSPYGSAGGSGAEKGRTIHIDGNDIDVTQTVDQTWPGRFAVLVANNQDVDEVTIADNRMRVRGRGWAFGLSGDRLRVRGNVVEFGELDGAYPPGAILVGFPAFGFDMGSSLASSEISGNEFSGGLADAGLVFTGGPNDSNENTIDLGTSLAGLGAPITVSISAGVHGNTFRGNMGELKDLSPGGSNTFE